LSCVERVNYSVGRAVETLLTFTTQHSQEIVDFAHHLQSLLTEYKMTLDYFQDEDSFDKEYHIFMSKSSRPTVTYFDIDGWELPLYHVYLEVISHGGFLRVSHQLCWGRIWSRVPKSKLNDSDHYDNPSFNFSTETKLKELYIIYLYPYEFHKRSLLVFTQ